MSELRWNPLLGEWVITATHRQDRTFLPPAEHCPLCPTRPGGFATEIPAEDFDIVVFENRFPSLQRQPPPPSVSGRLLSPVRPSVGVCEVVVYTPDHSSSLSSQPVEHIVNLIRVWADRFEELGRNPDVHYVFIFENRGEEIGVTLQHPHGQIYGYPFVPPRLEREVGLSRDFWDRTGTCLLCNVIADEVADARRIVVDTAGFTAFVPFFARWPYEVSVCPRRHVQDLGDLTTDEQWDLAVTLKAVLSAYDALWDKPMPYVMVLHQRPTDGNNYDHYHFRIELCPQLRTRTKLKYLAGGEIGAGTFINDSLPEEKAVELRAHAMPVVEAHITAAQ